MVGKLFPSHNSEILGDILINFEPLLHTYSKSLWLKSLNYDLHNLRKDSIIYHSHIKKKKTTTNTTLHYIQQTTTWTIVFHSKTCHFMFVLDWLQRKVQVWCYLRIISKTKRRCFDPMNREFGHSLFINMIRISMSYY